ncbi:STAS domain-containing protein [Luteimonas huabeiensis]|uniref:STAS domain-containing protein n=1 Tax=Luteimonas huabeiensis TaxID=1244513 RepID=UPI0004659320|nr:STAS domain-containing protein [Luteimonas huabeiensis]
MPTSTEPVLRREGDALAFAGPLLRETVPALWPAALRALDGARRFDLRAVPRIDSAGLALLAELAARAGGGISIDGAPAGLDELLAAYRLRADLDFNHA